MFLLLGMTYEILKVIEKFQMTANFHNLDIISIVKLKC